MHQRPPSLGSPLVIRFASVRRWLAVTLGALVSAGAAGCQQTSPVAPLGMPPLEATRVISLNGSLTFGSIQLGSSSEATLFITNAGTRTLNVLSVTGPAGYSTNWTNGAIPSGNSQPVRVRFSPTEERTYDGSITVISDRTSGANTVSVNGSGSRSVGPRTSFGSGEYLIGSDVAPGRYFATPMSGCFWERRRGLTASPNNTVVIDLAVGGASQLIVDILPGDSRFSTNAACGTWFDSARRDFATNVRAGTWLVGAQVAPGRYKANAHPGCYWARLRGFSGEVGDIVDSAFGDSSGQMLVEIQSGDAGFASGSDCGTWTPATVPTGLSTFRPKSPLGTN